MIMNLISSDKLLQTAKIQLKENNFELAKQILLSAINSKLAKAEHYELLAKIYDANNDLAQCLKYLAMACSAGNASAEAHYYLGKEYIKLDRLEEGIGYIHTSIEIAGDFIEGLIELGIGYVKLNNSSKALSFFEKALQYDKTNISVLFNLGKTYGEALADHENGLQFYNQILQLDPKNTETLIAKGILFSQIQKYDESNACYFEAINLNSKLSIAWHNIGQNLGIKKQYKKALLNFEKAIFIEPTNSIYLSNAAGCHRELKNLKDALYLYNKAIAFNSNHHDAWIGKSICEFKNNNITEAFASIDQAIKCSPDIADCWFWKGNFYADMKLFSKAIESYEKAKQFKHSHLPLLGSLLQVKMKTLSWAGNESLLSEIREKVSSEEFVIPPLMFQAIDDDPSLNLKCSRAWAKSQFHKTQNEFIPKIKKSKKIRIAYISPDFRSHPVLYLTEKIYELHDRSKFEIYGYHINSEIDDNTIQVSKKFDKFFYVEHLTDEDLIYFIREHEIDIAIDLAGHTQGARTNIFLNRIAKIQINYIGYPGTLGSELYDFIIGDNVITPKSSQSFYSEKILNLKRIFQPNGIRNRSNKFNSRTDLGLPEDIFIYCCFNSNYKISETVFNSWANILQRTNDSVLWLFLDDAEAKKHIYAKFDFYGISRQRVIFADKLNYSDHLSRLRFANLFLDTYPFNAGTTCTDSVWSGVPVLTLRGKGFCGKMSESILSFISLSELIASSLGEYEDIAVKLYEDECYYQTIKSKLLNNIHNSKLFDSKEYITDLECALISTFSSNT
jgi:predicted O-linked N-acetylglucosamine transferase (SPINDLY family)